MSNSTGVKSVTMLLLARKLRVWKGRRVIYSSGRSIRISCHKYSNFGVDLSLRGLALIDDLRNRSVSL